MATVISEKETARGQPGGGESAPGGAAIVHNDNTVSANPQVLQQAVRQSVTRIERANQKRQANGNPPNLGNPDAERALLGAILLDSDTAFASPTVRNLAAADFRDPLYQVIFLAARKAAKSGPLDLVTLADDLSRMDLERRLQEQCDLAHLVDLVNACPSAFNVGKYAEVVRDWARQREAWAAVSTLGASFGADGNFERALAEAADRLAALHQEQIGDVAFCSMDVIREFFGDVTWAWPAWIPIGHLSMIVGPQAVGKSWLAARLIATLTGCVDTWPDGEPFAGLPPDSNPVKVLLVETEEMRGVYAERLEAMGVDPHWVVFGPGDVTHVPDLLREADTIEQLAGQQAVGAIVIDSLSGGHSLKEESAQMRALLTRYAAMAARLHIPVVMVHHVRKRGELEPVAVTLDRVRGSSTITQFCRAIMALYRLDGGLADPVRVEMIKSTFAAPPDPLGFTISGGGLTFGDAPEEERAETQLDKAVGLLRALLADGPMPSTDLQDEADGAGISWDTMKRAKARLGIVARRDGKERKWTWGLPAH
jgi:putative DNA primase/helicase